MTFLVVAGSVFFVQKRDVAAAGRDVQRKAAVNTIYYSLEEVYYRDNQHYPRLLSAALLPSVDPAAFKDLAGVAIGAANSEYRYEPTGCDGDACKGYTISATLEKESEFIRHSRNN